MSEKSQVTREKREPKPTARYIEMVSMAPKLAQKNLSVTETDNDLESAESDEYDSEVEREQP
jgi:hypothetical protein